MYHVCAWCQEGYKRASDPLELRWLCATIQVAEATSSYLKASAVNH